MSVAAGAEDAHRRRRDIFGAGLLVLAWVFFTTEMVGVRMLSDELPIAQIAAVRTGVQAVLMLALLGLVGRSVIATKRLPLHGARALCSQGGMVLFYLAFALLPLALATTLTFMQAAFVTVLAAIFLGETIGWRRVAAVVVGFLGVLIVMRPGFGGFQPAMLFALGAAAASAALMTITRSLSLSDGRWTVMF
ncbi:MAG: EamA family transporter, partial [Pseudomonadota bacterium]